MSQLDVQQAKQALTYRLRTWDTPGNQAALAAGFIDDLVARGWQMAPNREDRPFPPKPADACFVCGKTEHDCTRNPFSGHAFAARDLLSPTVSSVPGVMGA